MGSLLRPVGPLPAAAYWLRRGLVLVIVLGLVLLLRAIWPFGGSDPAGGAVDAVPVAEAPAANGPASQSPSADAAPADPAPADVPGPSPSPSPTPELGACPDAAISVAVVPDAATYAAGIQPAFTLTVTNTGKLACRRDVGPKALSLVVTSGGAHVWSSDDCQGEQQSSVVPLAPGAQVATTAGWDRELTAQGCPSGLPSAGKGTYVVTGTSGKVVSPPAVFVLR